MSQYADAPRERNVQVDTAVVSAAPSNSTAPHIVTSPKIGDLPTNGFLLSLLATAAGAATGPFTVTVWRLNATLGVWMAGVAVPDIGYNQQWVCWDLAGSHALYFQIVPAAGGTLLVGVAEMP